MTGKVFREAAAEVGPRAACGPWKGGGRRGPGRGVASAKGWRSERVLRVWLVSETQRGRVWLELGEQRG